MFPDLSVRYSERDCNLKKTVRMLHNQSKSNKEASGLSAMTSKFPTTKYKIQ